MTHHVIYTRFSPRRNAEEAVSCETQVAQCRAFALERGWVERGAYRDEAVSGATELEEREGLMAAIADLQRGDVLLVYHRDRLARDAFLAEALRRMVADRGARIEAVAGEAVSAEDVSPEANFIRRVLELVAQLAREQGAARTKQAMLAQQRAGRRMGRFPPYGKRADPDDPARWVDEPLEAPAIKRVKELHALGLTTWAIAKVMSRDMPNLARGKAWNRRTVEKIVRRA